MSNTLINKWIEYDHLLSNGGSVRPYAKGFVRILEQRQPRRRWHVSITVNYRLTLPEQTHVPGMSKEVITFYPEEKLFIKTELSPLIDEEYKKIILGLKGLAETEGLICTLYSVIVRCTIKG